MRIPTGDTTKAVPFMAVDTTDLVTPELGLAAKMRVYRSRNGGAAALMTTPTITEADTGGMPGLYWLLVDEDVTMDTGDHSQAMAFVITDTGARMEPARLQVEIYRPAPSAANNAVALMDESNGIETGLTLRKAVRLLASMLGGKVSGAGTGTEVFRNAVADGKNRATVTVDSSGNRSSITYVLDT